MKKNIRNPIKKIIERLYEKVGFDYTLDTDKIQPSIESLKTTGTKDKNKIFIERITNMIYKRYGFADMKNICKMCKSGVDKVDKTKCFNGLPWYRCSFYKAYSEHEAYILNPGLLVRTFE